MTNPLVQIYYQIKQQAYSEDKIPHDEPLEYINEYFLHHLWAEQFFPAGSLVTTEGHLVRVKHPGLWNQSFEPDFKQALIYLDNNLLAGDIEIHLYSSDWHRHGHHINPAYNNVILHVVGWHDANEKTVQRADGQEIPQVILSPFLETQFEEIDRFLEIAGEIRYDKFYLRFGGQGRCSQWTLVPAYQVALRRFLEMAGEARLFTKATRLRQIVAQNSVSLSSTAYRKILYHGLMESLGYKTNQLNFGELARRVSFDQLAKVICQIPPEQRPITIQAILFHIGDLIPAGSAQDFDPETKLYLNKLRDIYEPYCELWRFPERKPIRWNLKGTRPANYPARRIAGASYFLAHLINEEQIMEDLVASPDLTTILRNYFIPNQSDYWLTHTNFMGKKLTRPLALIGPEWIRLIAVNVVIPVMMLYLENNPSKKTKLLTQYKNYPSPSSNYITRFVQYRLFGDKNRLARNIVYGALPQQGLIQLYQDFCAHGWEGCNYCGLVHWLSSQDNSRGGI